MKRIAFLVLSLSFASPHFLHADIWGEDVHPEDNAKHLGYGFRKIPPTDYFYDEAFVEGDVARTATGLKIKALEGAIENCPGRLMITVMFGDVSFMAIAVTGQKNLIFQGGNDVFLKLKFKTQLGGLFPEIFEQQLKTALRVAS